MSGELIYVVHPDAGIAERLREGLQTADFHVVSMSSTAEVVCL